MCGRKLFTLVDLRAVRETVVGLTVYVGLTGRRGGDIPQSLLVRMAEFVMCTCAQQLIWQFQANVDNMPSVRPVENVFGMCYVV